MATPRLPVPGQDNGTWGDLLNDFLRLAHNDDGSLKALSQNQVTGLTQALADKAAQADLDTLATTVTGKVNTTDGRLTDDRVPLDGSVTDAKVSSSAAISADKLTDGTNNKVMTAAERSLLDGATSSSVVNTLVQRSSIGWVQLSGISGLSVPGNPGDATSKSYVDAQVTAAENRANHTGVQSADTIVDGTNNKVLTAAQAALLTNATSYGTINTLALRDSIGNISFNRVYAGPAPTANNELTRKDYVDTYGSLSTATSFSPGATITPTAAWLPSTQVVTLTANATIGALPTTGGQLAGRAGTVTLNLIQATGSGPYTITWPSGIKWAQGAAAPAMPTTAGARLIVNLYWDGVSQWCGMVAGSF